MEPSKFHALLQTGSPCTQAPQLKKMSPHLRCCASFLDSKRSLEGPRACANQWWQIISTATPVRRRAPKNTSFSWTPRARHCLQPSYPRAASSLRSPSANPRGQPRAPLGRGQTVWVAFPRLACTRLLLRSPVAATSVQMAPLNSSSTSMWAVGRPNMVGS